MPDMMSFIIFTVKKTPESSKAKANKEFLLPGQELLAAAAKPEPVPVAGQRFAPAAAALSPQSSRTTGSCPAASNTVCLGGLLGSSPEGAGARGTGHNGAHGEAC